MRSLERGRGRVLQNCRTLGAGTLKPVSCYQAVIWKGMDDITETSCFFLLQLRLQIASLRMDLLILVILLVLHFSLRSCCNLYIIEFWIFLIVDLNYIFVSKMGQRLKAQKQILRKRVSTIFELCVWYSLSFKTFGFFWQREWIKCSLWDSKGINVTKDFK